MIDKFLDWAWGYWQVAPFAVVGIVFCFVMICILTPIHRAVKRAGFTL